MTSKTAVNIPSEIKQYCSQKVWTRIYEKRNREQELNVEFNVLNSVKKALAKPWKSQEEQDKRWKIRKKGRFRGTVHRSNTPLIGVSVKDQR